MGMTDQVVREVGFRASDRDTADALEAIARVLERARDEQMDADDALSAIGRIVQRRGNGQTYQKALG
jgi:hypothetical protein